jgi:hypothetical protein
LAITTVTMRQRSTADGAGASGPHPMHRHMTA